MSFLFFLSLIIYLLSFISYLNCLPYWVAMMLGNNIFFYYLGTKQCFIPLKIFSILNISQCWLLVPTSKLSSFIALLSTWFLCLQLSAQHLFLSFNSCVNYICLPRDLLATDLFCKNNGINKFTLSFIAHSVCGLRIDAWRQSPKQTCLLNLMSREVKTG